MGFGGLSFEEYDWVDCVLLFAVLRSNTNSLILLTLWFLNFVNFVVLEHDKSLIYK